MIVFFVATVISGHTLAKEQDRKISYAISTSLYTQHWNPKPEHNNSQELIGLERRMGDTAWGAAFFKNSFHQPSQFAYWSKTYRFNSLPEGFRSKVMFGFIHGYKGEYQNKIPFNQFGIAPAILPTIGYASRYVEADIVLLAGAAWMVTLTLPINTG
ncbi:MAG: sn-glycerol-3-phosphate transporter [Endozoicomonas sp.]